MRLKLEIAIVSNVKSTLVNECKVRLKLEIAIVSNLWKELSQQFYVRLKLEIAIVSNNDTAQEFNKEWDLS